MRRLVLASLLALAVTAARADGPPGCRLQEAPTLDRIADVLEREMGAAPFARGHRADGVTAFAFVNRATGAWAIVESLDQVTGCVAATGTRADMPPDLAVLLGEGA